MTKTRRITVLCVDDHSILREGLAAIIGQEPDMDVIGDAADGEAAVTEYFRVRPDVTLMDLQLPRKSGFDAIRAIREKDPDARIIVLSMYHGGEDVFRALQAGASAYLLKNTLADNLVRTIREVHEGRTVLADAAAAQLADRVQQSALTPREQEVIALLGKGYRNKEIAAELGISEGTVQAHVKNILAKLHVNDRTAALASAIRRGILHID